MICNISISQLPAPILQLFFSHSKNIFGLYEFPTKAEKGGELERLGPPSLLCSRHQGDIGENFLKAS